MVLGVLTWSFTPLTVFSKTTININDRVMKTKKCLKCGELKSINEFGNHKKNKDKLRCECKVCNNKRAKDYLHTKNGLINLIYLSQKESSKRRSHNSPTYTKQELKDWLFSQELFNKLFNDWKKSGFEKMLSPSVDRKNDYKGYSFDNIQLMTWNENKNKGHSDILNGINKKTSKAIIGINKKTGKRVEFRSAKEAQRKIGVHQGHISSCCLKIKGYESSGGYKWEFKNKQI